MSASSPPADAPIILVWSAGPTNTAEYAGVRISAKREMIRQRISSHLSGAGEDVDVCFSEDDDMSELAGRVGLPRRDALWTERTDLFWTIGLVALDVPSIPLTVRPELENVLLPLLEANHESLILRSVLVLWPNEFIDYMEGRNSSYSVKDPSAELLWHRIVALNSKATGTVVKVISYSLTEFADCSLAGRVAKLLEGVTIDV